MSKQASAHPSAPVPAQPRPASQAESQRPAPDHVPPVLFAPAELTAAGWERVSRRLLAKTLAEFAYEEIIEPVPATAQATTAEGTTTADATTTADGAPTADAMTTADGAPTADKVPSGATGGRRSAPPFPYTLRLDNGEILSFRARRGSYGSWQVDPDTIGIRHPDDHSGSRPFHDPVQFLALSRRLLALDGATLGHLVRELTTTLAADARLDHTALSAARLADLGYAELEGHQTGHPWLVLNKGRVGFSAQDAATWAPEARRATRLPWIAVSTALARYQGVPSLADPEQLYARELDAATRASFDAVLQARGLNPASYLYLPVHPWQWDESILPLFAPVIARGDIVPLPADDDLRLPQQSIRTFLNVSRPDRHTVKLPLSVLNTLVWRGLPTERTVAAPAVTAWVQALQAADPFLKEECRVVLLGEVASVAVEHPVYDHLPEVPYQYKELLGAIWREPLADRLDPGERARTLAALLHTDPQGRAFTAELVDRSGLDPAAWLRQLFAATLPPLLHFLYRYGTVFSPHGENAIVVFDEHDVPVRLAIKDFVDDVNVSAEPLPEHAGMPDDVRRTLLTEPSSFLPQFIQSGLFIGVFRYLAPLCEDQLGIPEGEFWSLVRAEILKYHSRFPELKDRFETFDLLTPRLERLCLNRNRLHTDGYRDRPHRPHAAVHGTVANPLHRP